MLGSIELQRNLNHFPVLSHQPYLSFFETNSNKIRLNTRFDIMKIIRKGVLLMFFWNQKKDANKSFVKKNRPTEDAIQSKISEKAFSKMVDNNLKGKRLEQAGKIEEAKKLYEKNISMNFEGNFPYDRLAVLYRKEKDYDNEIRVLNHAIHVFSSLKLTSPRADVSPKLKKFKDRLAKATELKKNS